MLRHACQRVPSLSRTDLSTVRHRLLTPSTRQRSYASITNLGSYPEPGEHIHGFTLKQKKHVPELHLTALQLEHDKTGAEYLHVARDDRNNVFAINFKTNPVDRTGLPHILEHVTLCGSEKYPVRDPFFKMMPRSLANFMNAFTSSDYTSYPFATTNAQDFKNLSSVYLDATLHPLLKHSDFLQEGWRLGPEDPREVPTNENVKFKGVVYNEMKGQMSDAGYLYYIRFREHIFPSLENSGGDPGKMTELSYEKLVKFSKQHYHPSNAKIFSYGNLTLGDHLKQVDQVLSDFNRIGNSIEYKEPIDLSQGQSIVLEGPLDAMQPLDRQVKSSISWLGCQTSDIHENFALSIMVSLLMNGYGSPLYQGLIGSGIGTNFSPNSGYDASAKVGIISIGLDGMREEHTGSLKETIHQVLREKADEAFQQHKVDGYMHQLEIALKHKTATFGMGLLEKTLPSWFNGTDPLKGLSWNEIIDGFKIQLKRGNYLQELLGKYLMNDRCLHFTMIPSESYSLNLEAQEEERRINILSKEKEIAGSDEAVLSKLATQELNLLHEQENSQYQNLDSLPSLHVQDIPKTKEKKPRHHEQLGDVRCMWRETDTNGITYLQAKHLFSDLPDELRLLLPLFTESLMRLGTKNKTVGDLEAEILLKTGGISIAPFTAPDPFSLNMYSEGLTFDGYALDRNVPDMLELIRTILVDVDFSSNHAASAILELLDSKTSGALDAVAESGHHFAISAAAAALSPRSQKQELVSGLSQIETTARLLHTARQSSESLQTLLDKLRIIQSLAISNTSLLSTRIVCEPSSTSQNKEMLQKFLQGLPKESPSVRGTIGEIPVSGSSLSRNTFFNLPFQVSYSGTCLQTVPYSSPDKASLAVLGQLLTHNFLHQEVREKGGAYGASASASPISGLFTMSSYRDPNPRNSLATFRKAGEFARDKDWSSREIEESKLSIFQQIDAPTSVSSEASKEFMYGITEAMDEERRQQLLSVNKEDIQNAAQRYLVDLPEQDRSTAILGEKKSWIDQEKDWKIKSLDISA